VISSQLSEEDFKLLPGKCFLDQATHPFCNAILIMVRHIWRDSEVKKIIATTDADFATYSATQFLKNKNFYGLFLVLFAYMVFFPWLAFGLMFDFESGIGSC